MASSQSSVIKASNGYVLEIGDMFQLKMKATGVVDMWVTRYACRHLRGCHVIDGRHRMVHNYNGVGVEMRDLELYMKGETWGVRKERDGALPGHEVAQRAIKRIGENNYNFIYNNCEHFANWCKYGRKFSEQADGWGNVPIVGPVLGHFSGKQKSK